MGKSNKIAAQGGLLPFLVSMVACLYPLHLASAASESSTPIQKDFTDTHDTAIGPPVTLNLSVMPVPGHIDQYVDQYLIEGDELSEWYADETLQRAGRRMIGTQFV